MIEYPAFREKMDKLCQERKMHDEKKGFAQSLQFSPSSLQRQNSVIIDKSFGKVKRFSKTSFLEERIQDEKVEKDDDDDDDVNTSVTGSDFRKMRTQLDAMQEQMNRIENIVKALSYRTARRDSTY